MTRTYDLHVHTAVSPCSRNAPSDVIEAARRADLDGVAVTDHDTVAGGERVAAMAPDDLDVIVGAEITTSEGHLLALDVGETPPVGTDPLDAIEFVHDQGGVAILAHPFDRLRQVYESDLDAIASAVDAVEVRNSRCLRRRYNRRAAEFARQHDLPMTGGSDGHFRMEIGRARTHAEAPILDAIREGRTEPAGRDRYLSGHVLTKLNDALAFVR